MENANPVAWRSCVFFKLKNGEGCGRYLQLEMGATATLSTCDFVCGCDLSVLFWSVDSARLWFARYPGLASTSSFGDFQAAPKL